MAKKSRRMFTPPRNERVGEVSRSRSYGKWYATLGVVLAGAVAVGVLSRNGPLVESDLETALNEPTVSEAVVEDPFDFLTSPSKAPSNIDPEQYDLAIPLGEPIPRSLSQIPFEQRSQLLQGMLQLRINPDNPNIKYSVQFYGVPEDPIVAEHMLTYSRDAVDFLVDRLTQFQIPDLEWVVLSPNQTLPDIRHKVIIANSVYSVFAAELSGNSGRSIDVSQDMVTIKYGNEDVTSDSPADYNWFVLLSTGPNSIQGAINEVLHVAATPVTDAYDRRLNATAYGQDVNQFAFGQRPDVIQLALSLGPGEADKLEEAFVHILSTMIAPEHAESFGIPNASTQILNWFREAQGQPGYDYFSQADAWSRELPSGPSSAFTPSQLVEALYRNPANFKTAIMSTQR